MVPRGREHIGLKDVPHEKDLRYGDGVWGKPVSRFVPRLPEMIAVMKERPATQEKQPPANPPCSRSPH